MDHDALRRHVLEHSLRTGAFTLKSGRTSTWFLDTKQTACRPDGILLVADAALAVIPPDVDAIGGLTMGADPVAFGIAAVAATRGRALRSFSIRKEAKDHGIVGPGGRRAAARRPGGGHRGHRHARHVDHGGGRGRAGRSAPSRWPSS